MTVSSKLPNFFFLVFITCLFFSCGNENRDSESIGEALQLTFQNPVLPGDFADPSVVRVEDDYWATATSSEWAPLFPILHSNNLNDWEIESHVFPDSLPNWAEAHFWAPEIAYDNDRYFIYYTAKKKEGPLCVGVASSKSATGPYEDHGPIVCQEAGAIDGFQIRDDEGRLYLIWKEDGNSRGEPTPMWGQEMNEERTELIGEKFELFRNDSETWEGNLVEGAYLLKKDGYFYAFYSGDACCGRGCTYGVGVARARNLRGPWEKHEENPIKKEDEEWKCAGHGSLVQTSTGEYYFLYHAYRKDGNVYTGRQGLIDQIVWNEQGWPEFKEQEEKQTEQTNLVRDLDIKDNFSEEQLSSYWQWPVGTQPQYELSGGDLRLKPSPENLGTVVARRTLSPDYTAKAIVEVPESGAGRYGLAAIGDVNNALGISTTGKEVVVWKVQGGEEEIFYKTTLPETEEISLRIEASEGENYSFSWSEDGENWSSSDEVRNIKGAFLPPWDRAVRIGLTSKGEPDSSVAFESFDVDYND